MDDRMKEAATMILCDVLGRFAFAFGEPAPSQEILTPEDDSMLVAMRFAGVMRGELALLTTNELGLEIAANVLGLEPDDESTGDRAPDAIKEVLNVVCGNLLTELAGDEEVFDLSIPAFSAAGREAWREWLATSDTVCLTVDDRPILMQLKVEGQGA